MKNLFKIFAAVVVMAGVCLLVYELFRRWDESGRKCSDGTLKHFIDRGLRKKDSDVSDIIGDYRDEDDDFFDDDFFADLDGSRKVEVEVEDSSADDDVPPVEFDLSEDALEQLLDG